MSQDQFSPETYPLGAVPVTGSAEAVFLRLPGGKKVIRIEPSCGCTTFTHTETEIRMTYQAGYLPDGVKEQNLTEYPVQKYVNVIFDDDTFQALWITATVYE